MKKFLSLLFCACISTATVGLAAEPIKTTHEGNDFWVAIPSHWYNPYQRGDRVTILSNNETSFRIEAQDYNYEGSVSPGNSADVLLPWYLTEQGAADNVLDKGIHITSDLPISVVVYNAGPNADEKLVEFGQDWPQIGNDAYLALPVKSLGKSYLALSYLHPLDDALATASIITLAVEDNTLVDLVFPNGETKQCALNRGQIYVREQPLGFDGVRDFTGTRITANKLVAVFTSVPFAFVPSQSVWAGDMAMEQMFPLDHWGTEYLACPLPTGDTDVYRVLANEPQTTVEIRTSNGTSSVTLDAGKFYQFETSVPTRVISDKPVAVAQYAKGLAAAAWEEGS